VGQCNVSPISQHTAVSCYAVIDDSMIPYAMYTTTETSNAFQWARQPPKLPLPLWISTPSNTILWVYTS